MKLCLINEVNTSDKSSDRILFYLTFNMGMLNSRASELTLSVVNTTY